LDVYKTCLRPKFAFVKQLLIGLTAFALAMGLSSALNAAPKKKKDNPSSAASAAADPVEREYQKLLTDDDAAQDEVDAWIREAEAFSAKGSELSKSTLGLRIEKRLGEIRKAYDNFLRRNPKHARARLAYGSFLNDIQDEENAVIQWEKARELDPSNPAAWNNLANQYGHRGPIKKAFEYYEKAIALDPEEPVYLQNLATTTYLFRVDAKEFYKITEQQVFDRSLDLYRRALKLDPTNFPLATDYAQTYYGIKPLRVDEALAAWDTALQVANDDFERQGIYVHLARIHISGERFEGAREYLGKITDERYQSIKSRLVRNLAEKQAKTTGNSGVDSPSAKINK
jgi:tetratricopeptide (TPR) repeat protein